MTLYLVLAPWNNSLLGKTHQRIHDLIFLHLVPVQNPRTSSTSWATFALSSPDTGCLALGFGKD
eukprot:2936520-Prorocentrum_lima.AAC.1